MQFKILHRIIGVNKFLHTIKKSESPRCDFCQLQIESIEHLFFECPLIKTFWMQVEAELIANSILTTKLFLKDIILCYNAAGNTLDNSAVNLLILHGKKIIFQCKKDTQLLSIGRFKDKIVNYYNSYIVSDNMHKLLLYEKQVLNFCGLRT